MRWTIALILAGLCFIGGSTGSATSSDNRSASLMPEVRLRKIHLVRPDLIPYPINYEVYC